MRFDLGKTVITPGALAAMSTLGESPSVHLARHANGDWGVISSEDRELNDQALRDGGRLLSVFRLNDGTKIWIITDAIGDNGRREATTILLPDEY